MAFQLSPGVAISEVDLTTVVPSVATTVGGIAGDFAWGPVDEITIISNENQLAETFGKPTNATSQTFFTAANFLSYASDLRVVRAIGTGSKNAGTTQGVLVKNRTQYDTLTPTSNTNFFIAKYPGELGNSVGVSLCDSATYSSWAYKDSFDSAPATSVYATNSGSTNDELHIVVYDTQGKISGATGTILEKYGYVSKASDAKNSDGSDNYYKNVLNNKSKYIWFYGHPSQTTNANSVWGTATANGKVYDSSLTFYRVTSFDIVDNGNNYQNGDIIRLDGGVVVAGSINSDPANNIGYISVTNTRGAVTTDGLGNVTSISVSTANSGAYLTLPTGTLTTTALSGSGSGLTVTVNTSNTVIVSTFTLSGAVTPVPETGNVTSAYDLFENPDSVDVSLLMAGPTTGVTIPNHLISIAESRKDCVVFVSPQYIDVVDNTTSAIAVTTTAGTYTKSSYAFMDSGWKYQFDKYNDVYRWVPLNGDMAGLCARTDLDRDPWFSPAGVTRGVVKNVVKLSWNPTKAERDTLYKAGVNPVVTFPGEGTILYGDKTLLNRPSAFDRINVRRLFIVLEKSIARAARSSLFEFNDEFTRAAFVNLVEPYLRDVKGRRGIYDYRVICDTTNNTPEVIDRNEFVGDIYIKPARSINYIQLNFVAVRTGVAFEEIVGSV